VTRIDLNKIWDDARAMASANAELLAVLAGMFVMLPMIVSLQLLAAGAPAEATPPPETMEAMLTLYTDYVAAHWQVLLGRELVMTFGVLAMLVLLLREGRPTVGESLRVGLGLLPVYLLAELLEGFMLVAAFMAFVLPFFYLLARLALVPSVAAAEAPSNPIRLIVRSIALTRGNGLRILLVLAILFLTSQLAMRVIGMMVSILGGLLLPRELAMFLEQITLGAMSALVAVATVLLTAALYRATSVQDARLSPR